MRIAGAGLSRRFFWCGSIIRAVPQLPYLEAIAAERLFSQGKANTHDICEGMRIVERH
jgi:hypothetical protein